MLGVGVRAIDRRARGPEHAIAAARVDALNALRETDARLNPDDPTIELEQLGDTLRDRGDGTR